jgi:hypothetical protein
MSSAVVAVILKKEDPRRFPDEGLSIYLTLDV